jgi:hypothetical protein
MLLASVVILCFGSVAATTLPLLSTTTQLVCETFSGYAYLEAVPTTIITKEYTVTVTRAVAVVPVTTITPDPVTQTSVLDVNVTATYTQPQDTTTITTTNSFAATSTVRTTSTVLITSTYSGVKVIPYPGRTFTVSTSSGFLPIQSDPINLPLRKRSQKITVGKSCYAPGYGSGYETGPDYKTNPDQYPIAVACEEIIETYTTKTVTTIARETTLTQEVAPVPPTVLTTRTSDYTTTVTTVPAAAVITVTVDTTSTTLAILVVTASVTTATSSYATSTAQPIATAYPGCAANNFVSSHNNQHIVGLSRPGGNLMVVNTLSDMSYTEATCCVAYVIPSSPLS